MSVGDVHLSTLIDHRTLYIFASRGHWWKSSQNIQATAAAVVFKPWAESRFSLPGAAVLRASYPKVDTQTPSSTSLSYVTDGSSDMTSFQNDSHPITAPLKLPQSVLFDSVTRFLRKLPSSSVIFRFLFNEYYISCAKIYSAPHCRGRGDLCGR